MSLDLGELVARAKIDLAPARGDLRDLDVIMEQASKGAGTKAGKTGGDALAKGISDAATKAGKDAGTKAGDGMLAGLKDKASSIVEAITGALGEGGTALATGFLGGIAGEGIADTVGGLADKLMGAVDAASDLNETVNKSQAIFGAQASAVEKWSEGSAENFGLSKAAALDYASSLGDMFTQLGNTGKQAASMSEKTVKLAADLGSFNNLDTGDVLERISAAFRGEYDSLQAIVPNINAARVQTEALSETGKKNANQLTAQEKATATLNIIMKDTSRAQGDFAKTAHQAANQSKINAAQVADLQAKVGQGLLPAYKAFLQLIGQVGLPALGHLVDAGGAVVNGIKPLVGLFNGLPGPVKAVAAAVGALYLANRLFGGQLGTLRGKVTGFNGAMREMTSANGAQVRGLHGYTMQMGRFGSAIERAGRSVPVIGQMQSAFVTGAAGADRFVRSAGLARAAMVGLGSAGRGLVGALGGPWGLALMGGVVALTAWQKHQQAAAQAAAESKQRVDELTETLNKHTGAVTEDTRTMVAQQLQQKGALDAANKLGIASRDMVDAALGNEGAQKRVRDAIEKTRKAYVDATGGMTDNDGAGQDLAKTMDLVTDSVGGSNKELQESTRRAKQLADATKKGTKATKDSNQAQREASPAAQEYTAALKDATTAQKNAKKAADDLRDGIDGVNNKFLETQQSEDGFEAAIDAATKSLKDNGRTLDANTEKGRNNRQALRDIITSGMGYADSLAQQGASAKTVAKQVYATRDAYEQAAIKMGYSRSEAKKLADRFAAMPKEVTTKVKADITKAQANLKLARAAAKDLGVDFDSLPKTIQTKLVTTNATNAKQVIKDYIDTTKGVPPGLHLDVDTPGADASMLRLKKLTVTALDTDGKIVQIPVKTPGQAEALHAIIDVRDAAVKTDGKKITIVSDAPMAKDTKDKIDKLRGSQVSADGKSITIDSSLPTYTKTLDKIRGLLGAAKPKSFTVTAKDKRFEHVLQQLGLVDAASRDKTFTITAEFAMDNAGFKNLQRHGIKIPAYASGTQNAPGGPALVAEDGAELVLGPRVRWLPAGAKVLTHQQTMAVLGAAAKVASPTVPVAGTGMAAAPVVTNYTTRQTTHEQPINIHGDIVGADVPAIKDEISRQKFLAAAGTRKAGM